METNQYFYASSTFEIKGLNSETVVQVYQRMGESWGVFLRTG